MTANELHQLRKSIGVSRRQLAVLLTLTEETLYRWEKKGMAKRSFPGRDFVIMTLSYLKEAGPEKARRVVILAQWNWNKAIIELLIS